MYAVFRKELADHFNSRRFMILFLLALLAAVFAIYVAIQNIRSVVTADTEFIFLKIFTTSGETLPSFLFFISLFIAIIGIALGFDAISSERVSGNLSRLLSQPIYRDAVINGKFLAGLTVLGIIVASLVAIVSGLGLRTIGVPPNSEEVLRLIVFVLISIIYGAFWMALSVLFSVFFNRAATSMLASIGLWIFFAFFMSMIAGAIANARVPIDTNSSLEMITQNVQIAGAIGRISPATLYGEATAALLVPELGSLNPAMMLISTYIAGRMLTPLPFSQSLLLVWPQLVSVVALAAICFAVSYIKFMREEIRSI
ncbi:MAG: ABC transporter [Dehalococcoidia bacterium CG2_30_46_9]|nr:MAG: ABC transporter [Dehalococcoidia bacterium CG2_30_46_9]PIX27271.1 MAG: ABC transporter [Chloroflexi bacterium CG_4_8_14_3_um_filter_45_15]